MLFANSSNIFSNNMSKFLHDADTKAISIPQVFSENNQAKNVVYHHYCPLTLYQMTKF